MDDVVRRREARRRKILENSQNRLNRITGIEQKSPTKLPHLQSHDFETDAPSFVDNNERISEVKAGTGGTEQVKLPHKQYRVVVLAGLAVFVNFLLILDALILKLDPKSTHLNKIFIPLFVYEVTQFFSSKPKSDKNFIYLLLIANAKNSHLVTLIKQLELVAGIIQDLMIYFFVFVCCNFVRYALVPS